MNQKLTTVTSNIVIEDIAKTDVDSKIEFQNPN
jgi:hypothetical protein